MREEKDRSAKWLLEHHGGALLRLGNITGFTSWRAAHAEVVLPRQLPDGLLEVTFPGRPDPELYVVEVASYAERRIEEEAARDAMMVYLARGIVPEVLTIVLAPKGTLRLSGDWQATSPRGTTLLAGKSQVIELWTLSAETLLAAGEVGLVPLVPLAQSNQPPDILLRQCRERIDREATPDERPNLLAVAFVLARLRYNDPTLALFLGGIGTMIESPAYDDFRAYLRGVTYRDDILENLQARFGAVPEDLTARVRAVEGNERLGELHRFSAVCPDLEAFRGRLGA
jgi:hypothetical protein